MEIASIQTHSSRNSSAAGTAPRAITIAILAMGGEGGGVLAEWIVDLGEHAGYCAQTTSVPGVAQRTGSTIYYIELFPEAAARAAGKQPVLALMPVPGEVDIVLASELMEAGRAVQRGLVTPDRTTLVASTNRVYSMTEKTAVADGRVDSSKVIEASRSAAKIFVHGDFARIADDARSVISASLFGALAATSSLPFSRAQFEEAIRRGGVGVETSLAAFDAGFRMAAPQGGANGAAAAGSAARDAQLESPGRRRGAGLSREMKALEARVRSHFPESVFQILFSAIERLADYQDEAYASEYLNRLEPIREAEAKFGEGNVALLRETARYLALWMSYEDAPRVADLKIRRERFERVKRDVRADASQILEIKEFLHPRAQEIADTLPASLGRFLLETPAARQELEKLTGQGKIVNTASVRGYVQLYMIAAMRRWRRKSLRFQKEQPRIEHWLDLVRSLAAENYALAVEAAELPRMVKGYGDTHTNGERNYEKVLDALGRLSDRPDAASRLRQLREAALMDDTGEKLAETMQKVMA